MSKVFLSQRYLIFFVSLLLLSVSNEVFGKNILFFFGLASQSHRMAVWPLVETLAEKGHNVTFFFGSTPKFTHPQVVEFSANDMVNFAERMGLRDFDMLGRRLIHGKSNVETVWNDFLDMGARLCDIILSDPNALRFINSSHFDLLIIDSIFNDCGIGLAYKFRAKHIIYSTTAAYMWFPEAYGYLDESSYYPSVQYSYPLEMSFYQRCLNSLRSLYWQFLRTQYLFPKLDKLFADKLELKNMPPLEDLEKNVSLVFVQRHFSEEVPRALPPLVVNVGGLHTFVDAKPLTQVSYKQHIFLKN